MGKLSIIIPAFNEESTIFEILGQIREVSLVNGISKEVIIIDDCSTDDTESKVQNFKDKNPELDVRYIRLDKNSGKGHALRFGISKASGDI